MTIKVTMLARPSLAPGTGRGAGIMLSTVWRMKSQSHKECKPRHPLSFSCFIVCRQCFQLLLRVLRWDPRFSVCDSVEIGASVGRDSAAFNSHYDPIGQTYYCLSGSAYPSRSDAGFVRARGVGYSGLTCFQDLYCSLAAVSRRYPND